MGASYTRIISGRKDDQGKNRLDLLPPGFVSGVGRVLTFGAQKYDAHNWMTGIDYSRLLAALHRHIWEGIAVGEDIDPESGILHAYHASCSLAFLGYFTENPAVYGEFDDRVFKPTHPIMVPEGTVVHDPFAPKPGDIQKVPTT